MSALEARAEELRSKLQVASKQRDELEEKIKLNIEALGPVGMKTPLIDKEGYPRDDIDITKIRQLRHEVVLLQNDHKSAMSDIEKLLHEYSAVMKQISEDTGGFTATASESKASEHPHKSLTLDVESPGMARVDSVRANSPAEKGGLVAGDVVVAFGTATGVESSPLQAIAAIVKGNIGKRIPLSVKRDGGKTCLRVAALAFPPITMV